MQQIFTKKFKIDSAGTLNIYAETWWNKNPNQEIGRQNFFFKQRRFYSMVN